MGDQIGLADGKAGFPGDDRHDDFAPCRVWRSDDRRHMHCGMFVKHVLDVVRKNVLAAADDHVLLAVDDVEKTLFVEPAHVAEREEIAAPRARGRLRVIEVFPDQGRATDMDFPDVALPDRIAVLVAQFDEHSDYGPAYRANFA